jgi:hypothetical protein
MLEMLFKVPSRILSACLNCILPTFIGNHPWIHGTLEHSRALPSCRSTHSRCLTLQKASSTTVLSFDMEKVFDRVGHHIILPSFRAFGVPEIMIMVIPYNTLKGFAYVAVNGRKGILITVKIGSSQRFLYQAFYSSLPQNPLTICWQQHS